MPETRLRSAGVAEGSAPIETIARQLLDDGDHATLLVDPEGHVALLNPAARRLFGITGTRGRGRNASELVRTPVPGDDPVQELRAAGTLERELMLVTPEGAEVPVLLRGWRLGRPPWLALVLRDRTQARRMQEELRRHERLATLGQLSAGVAHEIRNPLTGISTNAQVLLRRFEPRDDRARFVRVILEEVGRLDRIVTSLLQYARPRVPQLGPGRLIDIVGRVKDLSADQAAGQGVAIEMTSEPLPAVWIDADLITQVVLNVTLNALQAMETGGRLRYEVRRVRRRRAPRGPGRRASDMPEHRGTARNGEGGPDWMVFQQIRVTDTGSGIPRGQLSKLFDPFFTTKPRGTGLGLSICQSIMQEHGGSIEVASREGRGTTVMLNFPVEKRHGERRHPHADAADPADRR